MQNFARHALAEPVFDPERQIRGGKYHWWPEREISAGLTVNIGME